MDDKVDAVVKFFEWLRRAHPGLYVGAAVIHQNAYRLARECFDEKPTTAPKEA